MSRLERLCQCLSSTQHPALASSQGLEPVSRVSRLLVPQRLLTGERQRGVEQGRRREEAKEVRGGTDKASRETGRERGENTNEFFSPKSYLSAFFFFFFKLASLTSP